jgi:hypothetical protein
MKRRKRRREPDSFPLTLGIFVLTSALAALFLYVSVSSMQARAFYVGWCGHFWKRYNGDGMIRPATEPIFYWANVGIFGFLGVACATMGLVALWHLLTRFRSAPSQARTTSS